MISMNAGSSSSSSSSPSHPVMAAPPPRGPLSLAGQAQSHSKTGTMTPLTTTASQKASPSDVMFGQPPGVTETVQQLGALSSDSSPSSTSIEASSSSRRGSRSNSRGRGAKMTTGFSPINSETGAAKTSSAVSAHSADMSTPSTGASGMPTNRGEHDTRGQGSSQQATPPTSDSAEAVEQVKILPYLVDDADSEDIVALVADMLNRLMIHNDTLPLHPSALTRFHSRATPAITIYAYLRRIARYTSLDKACTLILLVYIDRVCERMKGFTICSLTVHRFVCAAVVCASKALCDAFSTNGHYARVGGISLVELNMLEKEFLNIIDWRLTCSGALLQHYYVSLVTSHPSYSLAPNPTLTSSPSPPSSPERSDEDMEEDERRDKPLPTGKGPAGVNKGRARDLVGDEDDEGRKRRGHDHTNEVSREAERVAQQRSGQDEGMEGR